MMDKEITLKHSKTEKHCKKCGHTAFTLHGLYFHKCKAKPLGRSYFCAICKRTFNHFSLFYSHKTTCVKLCLQKRNMQKQVSSKAKRKQKPSQHSSETSSNKPSHYTAPAGNGKCQNSKAMKQMFSARKSFAKILSSENEDPLSSGGLEMTEKSVMCLWCKSSYPSKDILSKHIQKNESCAKAYQQQELLKSSQKRPMHGNARKSMNSVVARKSFPHSFTTSHQNRYSFSLPSIEGSARKSLPNSVHHNAFRHTTSINSVSSSNQCPICHKNCRDPYMLFEHQKKFSHWGKATKSMDNSCKCPFCNKKFLSVQSRNGHLRYHASQSEKAIELFLRQTTCKTCFKPFSSEVAKEQHVRLYHSGSKKIKSNDKKTSLLPLMMKQKLKQFPKTCPICLKDFQSTYNRNKHFEEKHLDAELGCKFCSLKCDSIDSLEYHMQESHYDIFKFECTACKINLATAPHVVLHVTKVHADKDPKSIIRCRITSAESSLGSNEQSVVSLNVPISNIEMSGVYFCDVCNITFQTLRGLQNHRQSKQHRDILVKSLDEMHESVCNLPSPPKAPKKVPPPQPENIICNECSEEYSSVKEFVPHRLGHFGKKGKYLRISDTNLYKCEICGDISNSHSKVQLHLFWHLQVESTAVKITDNTKKANNNSIQVVAKKSFGKQSLESHQEVVIGGIKKQLFTCEACKIGFTTQNHYNLHVRKLCKANDSTKKHPSNDATENISKFKSQADKEKNVNHCGICNSLYSPPMADIHASFCKMCIQSTLELGSNVERLKAGMAAKNAFAACVMCRTYFQNGKEFSKHMLSLHKTISNYYSDSEENELPKHCKTCNCLFLNEDIIKNHHMFCCLVSYSNFDSKSNADILKAASALEDAVAMCLTCSSVLSNEDELREHIRSHTIDRPPNGNKTESSDQTASNIIDFSSIDFSNLSMDSLPMKAESIDLIADGEDDVILSLRNNFSQLLSILVNDHDLMEQLGYGQEPVDDVLINVLQQMGQTPILKDNKISNLECLRKNIQLLLDFCLKDQIMELIGNDKKTTDEIVVEALKMFSSENLL